MACEQTEELDLFKFKMSIPPIFEDFNELVKDYFREPEYQPFYAPEYSQGHKNQKRNNKSMFSVQGDLEIGIIGSIQPVRDLETEELSHFADVPGPDPDHQEGLSMERPPLHPSLSTRGSNKQSPFRPAGFEIDKMPEGGPKLDLNNQDPDKFLGEAYLSVTPGRNDVVLFAEDGVTLLTDGDDSGGASSEFIKPIEIKIDVEKCKAAVDKHAAYLFDIWKSDDDTAQSQNKQRTTDDRDDHDLELDKSIFAPAAEVPEPPILNITNSNVKIVMTSTEWAETIDVSQPVPDFREILPNLAHTYPFELDNFQKQAILKLEEGHHVFVAAHTSAGKTVVAEYAIAMSRRSCTRSIYTSPIKALSNQKYNDFNKLFGEVGLLTGDLQINPGATCLVMTTEILRSMLYCGSDVIRDLEFVIFDEVHYINNAERGYVWEEVLILLPSHVTIVMLSATVPNTLQFADWVGRTKRRKVFVVSTPKRPVPLCHYLYTGAGGRSKDERFMVIDKNGEFLLKGYNEAVAAKKARMNDYKKNFGPRRGGRSFMNPKAEQTMWIAFIDHLKRKDKLPVVAFTLSRNRCDQNADALMSMDMTTGKEKSHIRSFFQRCIERLNEPDRLLPQVKRLRRVLENGIGVHHSGILPMLKEIVEMLFSSGFVKVLFATETFAMGVNMPARTVVFDEMTKFDGVQRRALAPAEYIQMAGRAGRRGLDETGTVIVMCKDEVPDLAVLKAMMLGIPHKLSSQFRVTYAMILSLLRAETVSVEGMMQRSFREFNQIVQADSYREQLKLAEKEYADKCSAPLASHLAPLATFYDVAIKYIDVLSEIMPILIGQPKVLKEMVPGKVLILSSGPYINQLGILLNTTGPRQSPYKVLVLNTKEKDTNVYNFEIEDNWYKMLGFTAMYDYVGTDLGTLDHTIITIAPKDIVAITKMTLKIDEKLIIQDYDKRCMPRFKDAPVGPTCLGTVQELSRLSHAVRTGASTLERVVLTQSMSVTTGEILETLDVMHQCMDELEKLKKSTDIANYKSEFASVFERKQAERKRDKYKRLLSFENLALYPDYQSRQLVLRELNYIDDKDRVILKGKVACSMATNELMITELILRNVFTDKDPAEIAALLSCFVFQAKTNREGKLTPNLEEGVRAITLIESELSNIEAKHMVNQYDGQGVRLNFGLVQVVYEWAQNKPFADIMELTDVQEGIIVRCIQQLYETLVDVKDAAMLIGDMHLRDKMIEGSATIKRDIVFAASLYTHGKEAATG